MQKKRNDACREPVSPHCEIFLPRAFTVSLENVLLDVKELQRGMELTKREYSMHGHNTMLKDFITHNESKLKKLQDDAKIAQVTRALGALVLYLFLFFQRNNH